MRTFEHYYYEQNLLIELNRQKKEYAKESGIDPNQRFKDLISNSGSPAKYAIPQAIKNLQSTGKPKPGYQYTTEKKLLVRCIPSFIGIYAKDNGDIVFHRDVQRTGESLAVDRKTIHFTINGVVSDHSLGNSWENAMIAIIADPTQIKERPRTVRFEDTWYMVDKNNELNIGRATVLIPAQMQIPEDMRSANIKRYPGNTSNDRDQAINNFLKQNGVNILNIHAHGAQPVGLSSFGDEWDEKNEIVKARKDLNSIKWKGSGASHAYSSEGFVEGIVMSISSIYKLLKENNLTFNSLYDYNIWLKLRGQTVGHNFEAFINMVKGRLPIVRNELIDYRKEDKNSYFYFARAYKYMKEFLQKVDNSK